VPAASTSRNHYKNRILASLPKGEIGRLAPYLSPLILEVGMTLIEPGEDITHAYFLESGLASVVVAMSNGTTVEAGIIGNEGVVGIPALLGTKSMPSHTYIQIPGEGYRIRAQYLGEEFKRPRTLQKQINHFLQAHLAQTAQTAACNRLHNIGERLARWLLMCHDRMESEAFTITQESLGNMLGTPRTTLTLAAGQLQKADLIDYSRGRIHIKNRKGLEMAACECYQTMRNESERLGISANNV
jgi:CRP-like cAMP-binding protein